MWKQVVSSMKIEMRADINIYTYSLSFFFFLHGLYVDGYYLLAI